jgi:hypothetical protein
MSSQQARESWRGRLAERWEQKFSGILTKVKVGFADPSS